MIDVFTISFTHFKGKWTENVKNELSNYTNFFLDSGKV